MTPHLNTTINEITRQIEAHASLEQDLIRYAAPVFAGIRAAAMFSCPLTRKDPTRIKVEHPQVLLESEFEYTLERCHEELKLHGVRIMELARRDSSALLFIYRPSLLRAVLAQPAVASNLVALGYQPAKPQVCLEELQARIQAFDQLDRPRDFWDFPHEVGYFLGYPPVDVMAYTRNRGHGHSAHGIWHVYGCKRRVAATKPYFDAYAECTQAYWKLYLEGARLGDLAALHAVSPA